jgi:hypothetical protein
MVRVCFRIFFELHNPSEALTTFAHVSLEYTCANSRCLTVDGNIVYQSTTESTTTIKSWEIRSHKESNQEPELLPRLL